MADNPSACGARGPGSEKGFFMSAWSSHEYKVLMASHCDRDLCGVRPRESCFVHQPVSKIFSLKPPIGFCKTSHKLSFVPLLKLFVQTCPIGCIRRSRVFLKMFKIVFVKLIFWNHRYFIFGIVSRFSCKVRKTMSLWFKKMATPYGPQAYIKF